MLALRALIVLTICLLTVGARSQSQPPPEEHSQTHQPKFRNYHEYPATAELGTDKSPIIVRIIPTPKTDAEAAQDKKDRENKSTQDQSLVAYSATLDVLTAILVAVGALQLFVFGYQAWQLRQTVAAMKGQSEDMRASIAEANRAANAMENMSVSLKINADKIVEAIEINKQTSLDQRNFWLRQMRSYLSVVIGVAIYQERDRGIRFEARPSIKNNGSTPAYNVRYRASAALLPVAMQNDFKFYIPKEWGGNSTIGPHSSVEGNAIVPDFVPDDEVKAIKAGDGKCLYVWGVVTYRDISKKLRRVTFAQKLYWAGPPDKEIIKGLYLDRHNQSN